MYCPPFPNFLTLNKEANLRKGNIPSFDPKTCPILRIVALGARSEVNFSIDLTVFILKVSNLPAGASSFRIY